MKQSSMILIRFILAHLKKKNKKNLERMKKRNLKEKEKEERRNIVPRK